MRASITTTTRPRPTWANPPINAGNYTVTATYAGDANHTGSSASANFTVNQATATVVYSGYTGGTYDGNRHTQTVTVTGVGSDGTLYTTSLSETNAGVYSQAWSFSNANYNPVDESGTLAFTIGKATPTATLAVSNSPRTYTGSGQSATVSISTSSVLGTVRNILTGGAASETTAGTYAVTANFVPNDTTDYNTLTGLSAGNFVIGKATPTATLAVSNSSQTYTGSGQSATVSISTSSVLGTVSSVLTGGAASETTAGTYAVTANFVPNDTTDYNTLTGLSAGNFVIGKATPTATLAVSNSPQTYTGSGQSATVSISTSSVLGTVRTFSPAVPPAKPRRAPTR